MNCLVVSPDLVGISGCRPVPRPAGRLIAEGGLTSTIFAFADYFSIFENNNAEPVEIGQKAPVDLNGRLVTLKVLPVKEEQTHDESF